MGNKFEELIIKFIEENRIRITYEKLIELIDKLFDNDLEGLSVRTKYGWIDIDIEGDMIKLTYWIEGDEYEKDSVEGDYYE